jgi:hypothetical protein
LIFVLPSLDAGIRCRQIFLLEYVCLFLPVLRRKDEVIWDDWKLIQNEEMRGILFRDVCDQEFGRRVLKGVESLPRTRFVWLWFASWLIRKRGTVTKLKLIVHIEVSRWLSHRAKE